MVCISAFRLIPAHAGKTLAPAKGQRQPAAHPRSRGENPWPTCVASAPGGSSPLTRGKLESGLIPDLSTGLIPAHAGKTRVVSSAGRQAAAHPRSRGENRLFRSPYWWRFGSSPLTRGKHVALAHGAAVSGLIPAHAGKTNARRGIKYRGAAHPRSRGENDLAEGAGCEVSGSSPLTRGKQVPDRPVTHKGRLIPAHAGKTTARTPSGSRSRAHPRSRGENY